MLPKVYFSARDLALAGSGLCGSLSVYCRARLCFDRRSSSIACDDLHRCLLDGLGFGHGGHLSLWWEDLVPWIWLPELPLDGWKKLILVALGLRISIGEGFSACPVLIS